MDKKNLKEPDVTVVIDKDNLYYPDNPPFSPQEHYPEYPFDDISEDPNSVYDAIRQMFFSMGYDKENFGKKSWNPFKNIISPGQKVVIKPNWVMHTFPSEKYDSIITHSSLIRAILDYVIIALDGDGLITIGDAAIQSADFSKILSDVNVNSVISFLTNRTKVEIRVEDFRREISARNNDVVIKRIYKHARNFVKVNLEDKSFLYPLREQFKAFRVTNYDKDKMIKYHNLNDHIYVIHKSIMEADAVISIPKLKSHRKAGMTCCLKNSVGINCQKDCLPHHRKRSIEEGGDAYEKKSLLKSIKEELYERFDKTSSPSGQKLLIFCIRVLNKLIKVLSLPKDFEGSWYGNDTVWRTILDINNILFCSDKKGAICGSKQRKMLYIVDGIVAGEGEGPLKPTAIKLCMVAAGENPLTIDLVIAKVMGYDYKKIPSLFQAVSKLFLWEPGNRVGDIRMNFNRDNIYTLKNFKFNSNFKPSSGWKNHIEL